MNKIDFAKVKEFFQSWGMFPFDEDCNESEDENDWLNPEVIEQGINRKCYEKLLEDADRFSASLGYPNEHFKNFCASVIDATDDSFYIRVKLWDDLEDCWKSFKPR